eukprot:365708-Chlamydomonas_euryale.AAC.3
MLSQTQDQELEQQGTSPMEESALQTRPCYTVPPCLLTNVSAGGRGKGAKRMNQIAGEDQSASKRQQGRRRQRRTKGRRQQRTTRRPRQSRTTQKHRK